RGARGAFHRFVTVCHQGTDCRGCGVELVDLVLVHDLPEARVVGPGGHTFEHQRGSGVAQRSVEDVAVAGHPANVCRAPVDVPVVVVEDVLVCHRCLQEVTRRGVQDALGLAGGTGGVEHEQRILTVHRLGRTVGADVGHGVVIPEVAPFLPGNRRAGALHHDHA